MKVEIIEQKEDILTLKLHSKLDVRTLVENAENGRYFAYLDPWLKGSRSREQLKHYWALIGDIHDYTGERKGFIVHKMKYLYMLENDTDKEPSMADNKLKKEDATNLIQIIIDYCIEHDIPLKNQYTDYFDTKQIYALTMKRQCVICAKPHSEIHHVQAVGAGRNRKKIDHSKHQVLALCRQHHTESHTIGQDTFLDRYALEPIRLSPEQVKELGL